MPNRKSVFQFSLGSLLIAMLLAGVSIGWYISSLPVQLAVEPVMDYRDDSSERTNTVTEIRSWGSKGKVEQAYRQLMVETKYYPVERDSWIFSQRKAALIRDPSKFLDSNLDKQVVEEYESILKTAKRDFDQTSDFEKSVTLGKLLFDFREDQSIIKEIARRFDPKKDATSFVALLDAFPASEICKSDLFVAELRKRTSDLAFGRRAALALFRAGVDEEPWIQRCRKLYSIAGNKFEKERMLAELIKIAPDASLLGEAIELISEGQKSPMQSGASRTLIEVLLKSELLQKTEQASQRAKFKTTLVSFTDKSNQSRQFPTESYFNLIAIYGGVEYKKFLIDNSTLETAQARRKLSRKALVRLGCKDEAKSILAEAFEQDDELKDDFELYINVFGREKACEDLLDNVKKQPELWKLQHLNELASEKQRVELLPIAEKIFLNILNRYDLRESLWYREQQRESLYEILDLLENAGHPLMRIEELQAKIPSDVDFCRKDDLRVVALLKWANENLRCKSPITFKETHSVLLSDHLGDSFGNVRFDWFKNGMLRVAGSGAVIEPDLFDCDGFLFAEIAKLAGDEFVVSAHDTMEPNTVKMVVNNRLYSFPVDDSCSWFDVVPACEILNTIAKRQKLKGRFFVSPIDFGNSYVKFVWYAEPQVVKEFAKGFEFPIVAGAESYWEGETGNSGR